MDHKSRMTNSDASIVHDLRRLVPSLAVNTVGNTYFPNDLKPNDQVLNDKPLACIFSLEQTIEIALRNYHPQQSWQGYSS